MSLSIVRLLCDLSSRVCERWKCLENVSSLEGEHQLGMRPLVEVDRLGVPIHDAFLRATETDSWGLGQFRPAGGRLVGGATI